MEATRVGLRQRTAVRIAALIASVGLLSACMPEATTPEAWVEVGVGADGTKAFVDQTSVANVHGGVHVRERYQLLPGSRQNVSRVEREVTYSCSARTGSVLRYVEFNPRGEQTRTEELNPVADFVVVDGMLPSLIFEVLC